MQRPVIKGKHGPEYKIQQDIIKYLEDRGWLTRVVSGGLYNVGLPDIIACHKIYGIKFIEVKTPVKNVTFTKAQWHWYPKYNQNGAPVYVLTGADHENYMRLFDPSNLWLFMGGLND